MRIEKVASNLSGNFLSRLWFVQEYAKGVSQAPWVLFENGTVDHTRYIREVLGEGEGSSILVARGTLTLYSELTAAICLCDNNEHPHREIEGQREGQ